VDNYLKETIKNRILENNCIRMFFYQLSKVFSMRSSKIKEWENKLQSSVCMDGPYKMVWVSFYIFQNVGIMSMKPYEDIIR